jgi:hypothetical protein
MDKVQKYNSFNTNTPSSESYRNYLGKGVDRQGVRHTTCNTHCLFEEAVKGQKNAQPQQPPQHQTHPFTEGEEKEKGKPNKEKERDQPGQTTGNKHTSTLNNMFKAVTVVQQIMSELNESVSEEGKIVAITKIVTKLLNNEH